MNILLIAAFVFAALDALALWKHWLRLEYIAKPAVIIVLFTWLWTSAGLSGALIWFGLGLLLSLVGDVLLMLSAMLKLTDVKWEAGAALLVSLGAILFYISDIILAWNKFVSPLQHGRLYNSAAYHLGQIALIAGVIIEFGR